MAYDEQRPPTPARHPGVDELIKLVRDHRERSCAGQDCNISLYPIRVLLDAYYITLTDEERALFL